MPSAKYFHYDVRVCIVSFSRVGGVFFVSATEVLKDVSLAQSFSVIR